MIELYRELLSSREVFLWGAGILGGQCLEWMEKVGIPVAGFLDSNDAKHGSTAHDKPVYAPSQVLKRTVKDYYIIFSTDPAKREMARICRAVGLREGYDYASYEYFFLYVSAHCQPPRTLKNQAELIAALDGKLHALSAVDICDYPYNPVPRESFSRSRIFRIIEEDFQRNKTEYVRKVGLLERHAAVFCEIPFDDSGIAVEPYWSNHWMSPLDGASLYSFLAEMNPRRYIEIGSGNSTKFVAKAIRDNSLRTEIISIDPHPRAEIKALCAESHLAPLEQMDMSFFKTLTEEDILVLDGSHRSFPNSDVTVFFTEIVPELPAGLVYAIHDIALPDEVYTERYYNEQYMLAVYLIAGGMGDEIYFPSMFLARHSDLLTALDARMEMDERVSFAGGGGFFWLRKK